MSQPIVVVNKQLVVEKLAAMGVAITQPLAYVPMVAIRRAELDKFLTAHLQIMERQDVENDPTYWQLIPYGVITDELGNVVGYRRPDKQKGEARLRGARSVGFGGHVDEADSRDIVTGESLRASVMMCNCLFRELQEELDTDYVPLKQTPYFTGLLIDNSNSVGQVHLGFVYRVYGMGEVLRAGNPDEICELTLLDPMTTPRDEFENWSKLVLDNVEHVLNS